MTARAAVIMAAGHGTRMKSALPKVMHGIGGRAMIAHVIDATAALSPARMAVVIGDHAPQVGDFAKSVRSEIAIAVQAPPQGTAHAVMQALPALDGFSGAVLVLYADTPLVTPDSTMTSERMNPVTPRASRLTTTPEMIWSAL